MNIRSLLYTLLLPLTLFSIDVKGQTGPATAPVVYEVIYNTSTCLYEAHAHVQSGTLNFPFNIPFPSNFTIVIPESLPDLTITATSYQPPSLAWTNSNNVYSPEADPDHDFHMFSISGGGAGQAYTTFTSGDDILLFTFSIPHISCEEGIRVFENDTDPDSGAPGMLGLDLSNSLKTFDATGTYPQGIEQYTANINNTGVVLPKPDPSPSFDCSGTALDLSSNPESPYPSCLGPLTFNWSGPDNFTSTEENPSIVITDSENQSGTYSVTVTDTNGCSSEGSIDINSSNCILLNQPPMATDNESLANVAGDVTQQVVTEDDGDGVDNDPDGSLIFASLDLDPGTAGIQSSLFVAGEGTWSVDGAGNVTFAPIAGFTNDPTPIEYTINDDAGNTSNTATIIVDYVPVASDDLSAGNTTNTNVTVDILANDTNGDLVDATTVTLELTGLPVDVTCTATDAQGDCIQVTVPGQGIWSVDETTGAITFDPEAGFTANPDPITYTVEDNEGNPDSALLTIEFDVQPPIATDNESLANTAGDVTQQVVTEDDGDGVDNDPDGALSLASLDLDPATAGIQSLLVVAGEGTWSVDGAGNVTFAPEAGFTNDPTPIDYTINDNDGNTSNTATIIVDYVPVATDDLSAGNTTNTNVTVDVIANDTIGDLVDATTVTLELIGLPVDATCTATDTLGDCIQVTVPGQGVWSVDETTGAITFDPETGFTANPDPITYTVEDHEGNPDSALLTIEFDVQPPIATDNESLANVPGDVTQQVVTEDDGDGVDSDPDGALSLASVDLDPGTAGIQSSLVVAGEGTWSVDGAGNVTFAPIAGFTNDPTPIDYTINDNDGNTSNTATIIVDYVPVATDDLSAGNTTNNNVTVDILANDTDGDLVDATTVTLELTGLPVDATCTATDAQGDCIQVTVPGQGVWSVDETTGAITFDPEAGFTANPDPITYTVEDNEGNPDSATLTIEFTPQPPTATDNESLANVPGDVTQQVVTEDDGDGVDADPDGALSLASVDLDPGTAGIQSSLIVAGEGTWSVDGAGNVTFAPIAGFTNDPTPIEYTINDDAGNTSNTATIIVDYVPVASDDLSAGNTTNTNVTVDILSNDTDGDLVDATTVTLELTGLPGDATCTATDAQGDCIQVTVPGQGVWSVDETTGAITFDPETGFTANPDPITYTVEDNEGNPDSGVLTIEFDVQAPTATDNESLANVAGDVTQQVVTEDDGSGVDVDPDGALALASVDLDPTTAGIQSSLIVAGEGTWSVDGAGNVTFAPIAGFTNDPTPIEYTINDNDGNTSNTATIIVDYVPVASDDLSAGNTTNTNVTVDILANDTDGDLVDATSVTLELTGLPGDATCTATDAQGDCIQVTVPGQGVWSVDETTGAITFDPEAGFTANPDPITYTVEDNEGNPDSATLTIEFTPQPPTATDNESLANVPGDVTQQVVTEDDGDGVDSDPDGALSLASVDLDPGTAGIQSSLIVAGEGTWSVDGAGNVTFAPIAGFTNDPTPIDYTINDNDGNTSNTATIIVDYVPVASDDLSAGNTTNNNVTVDILANDTDGDLVDATTVTLELTGLPGDATCTATDAQGDCIQVTVPGQGVWSVDETTGAITFDPEDGFTANPDPITYTVEDNEGNPDSALLTIEFTPQPPIATDNESLANPAGDVIQQVVTEDDGDGIDSDPDGALSLASVDLDPGTAGIQSSLVVAGEGTWSVDGAGNVTFAPIAGFTNDPTPIDYTINDNDGNTSNTATIIVDYVPVASDDLSAGNTTNTNVTVDILANDTDGDLVDATTVTLELTGLPGDATCTANDAQGDCIQVTVPGQGIWSVDETTGAITFDPEAGFTANPDPVTYTVEDNEGNPDSATLTIEFTPQPPIATDNESLANPAGDVTQQVVTEDDGDGIDSDPDGALSLASVDLDPGTAGIQSSLVVAGEGTWSVDGAGNVTFAPIAGFTNDPTPIDYTINDNDGNTSNTATIIVDYVPVASDDLSAGNTTNNNVTVDILANDTDGDLVDATTVTLELTGLPVDALCTATDAQGDCIQVTVPGQGVWSVDETTGAITFDPEAGFTANPDPITYTVEDNEGNPDSALLTIEFTPQPPTATDNESLANPAGDVTQQVVTEDDGDGVDADPDGSLTLASVDLDPATAGVQSSLIVAGEGTWSVDGAGNVTFAPIAGFTNDPTPIDYTINDNDGNTSNTATIIVDYVPVASDDLSAGNTTNTNVTVDILANDTDGDLVDATSVTLELTGLPVDATCTANDAQGDCIQVTVPGQGVWSVDETTGAITFDPEAGFTADPDPITYTVEDNEGNPDSALLTIEFDAQPPVATDNESLANVAGPVTQQVVTEDDGDGVDADPDGSLSLASVDLNPGTPGIQSSFVVTGEGAWVVDGAGNVTFSSFVGFTNDPTPINYTINDNDGNTSNTATIIVDYVPVAIDDLSAGNTTNTNVTVDILANDTDGDLVDATTVTLELTGLPGDATCTATDAQGDCIQVTVPGQGVWSVDETTGAITFDPEDGFTADPDPITYTVEDNEGNPDSALLTIEFTPQPPTATDNESLANVPGDVTQQVVTEDDGDGVDSDPDGALSLASVDLDPGTAGIQSSLVVAGEGNWSVDGAGNVTFAPIAGFTNDPTPIDYTINDNDGNTSNTATIIVDYVPVASDDLSAGNTTNTNVTVEVLANDTDGDLVDATTVTLELTGLPGDALCTANDAQGDCIEVTVPGQGVWSVDETTGAITFDPEVGFTANPDPITYTVEDNEGNPDSALLTIEFTPQPPVATDNESLANVAGDVTQQVVTEDDGDGVDSDPDGALSLASVDLDPGTAGIQSSLVVAGEGAWIVDGAGNVTFAPFAGFTNDPTPIDYTINDNDGNTSNTATIIVDYVPVATDDLSAGNTTNNNVTVDVLANDTNGDLVDATTVTLELTDLPVDATCTATDAQGDCIQVTVPGQGVYSVDETTGAITFDPEAGFTADPDPITYTVEDNEGNTDTAILTIEYDAQPPVATYNESLANVAGPVTQEVIAEDDGDGVDSDPDGLLNAASIDLDPVTPGNDKAFVVPGEGTWTEDGAGNVTFTPIAGFTNDPTPILYTISDNDGNVSNADTILVDYVPVAENDESLNNTTNTAVNVDILANDISGDEIDITTIQIVGTTNPGDDFVVVGEGTWSINPTTGEITFTPLAGFTANPTDITYTAEDHEGNPTSATVNIEYTPQPPVATNNESLANLPGSVTQQIVTEDDGNGVDSDPDGSLNLASIDLDPTTAGIQTSLIVAGQGTWSVDGAGNVTFAPIAGFTYDPSLIEYTINDNDGNTSNTAAIVVDYVPLATDDLSTGNITDSNVTVDILANDTDGDLVDATTVTLELIDLPVDASCTANDAQGDCIEVTIPGQGVYSVNETTGAITFDPEDGFTADPDPITYTVEDLEGNPDSALLTIGYEGCVQLNLRVYLEGSLVNNGGATGPKGPLMRDDLRSSPYPDVIGTNYLPAEEPYSSLPSFTHVGDGGGEIATSTAFDDNGENSVVDWVFVELRDKLDSTSVTLTRSALLQKDGDVVDIDGVSPLQWCGLLDDTYYIVVRHRNHIGVMTAQPEVLTVEGTIVDFTNGNFNLSGEYNFGTNHPEGGASGYDYEGLSQKTYLGVRALWLGNAAHNDKVKYESPGDDKSQILFDVLLYPTNTTFQGAYDFGFGYHSGDLNMDSKVKYEAPGDDQSLLLFQILLYPLNNTFQSAFDFMYEQIPNN